MPRNVKARDNIVRYGLFYLVMILLGLLVVTYAKASDYHQRTQGHRVVYVVTDSSGNPVTGQTIRLQVMRVSDDAVLDHSDNAFKFSGWTTRYATMNYNPMGEFYSRTITIDSSTIVSGDYVCIVSNDNATYGDQQAEVVMFDTINDLIKIHR